MTRRTCDKRLDLTTDGPKCPISGIVIKDWDKVCDQTEEVKK